MYEDKLGQSKDMILSSHITKCVIILCNYGSLYVTLCFVLCPFDFGVLTIYFCILSSLFVYNVAHFKRRNSRGRAKMENKRGKKDESISILIHPS